MRIRSIAVSREKFALTRPYAIAGQAPVTDVENVVVRIETEDGASRASAPGSPGEHVTGETNESCRAALAPANLEWLRGRDVRTLRALCRESAERFPLTPAARAAVDIALHDLLGKRAGLPLADVLGRAHDALADLDHDRHQAAATRRWPRPTSTSAADFRVLKVKIGDSLEEDVERLAKLREHVGRRAVIRVDANIGYSIEETARFFERTRAARDRVRRAAGDARELRPHPGAAAAWRARIAADESLHGETDALDLAGPAGDPACGIYNIKLMKCGGVWPALRIAAIAETAGVSLMWGCMDESRISIAAALHAAFASPATRYLDLDGSLDLARDVVVGRLHARERRDADDRRPPGLGVSAISRRPQRQAGVSAPVRAPDERDAADGDVASSSGARRPSPASRSADRSRRSGPAAPPRARPRAPGSAGGRPPPTPGRAGRRRPASSCAPLRARPSWPGRSSSRESFLRPKSAPSTVAPTEIAVCTPASTDSCFSRPTACSARRRRSWSEASFARVLLPEPVGGGVPLLARLLLKPRAEVRLALPRLRDTPGRRALPELERLLPIEPGREVLAPGLRRSCRHERAGRRVGEARRLRPAPASRSSDAKVGLLARRPVERRLEPAATTRETFSRRRHAALRVAQRRPRRRRARRRDTRARPRRPARARRAATPREEAPAARLPMAGPLRRAPPLFFAGGVVPPLVPRTGSISVLICARVSGPRRYDIAQRVSKTTGRVLVDVVQQEHAAAQSRERLFHLRRGRTSATRSTAAPSRPSSTRALSRSVWSRPRNQVPVFARPL